MDFEKSEVELAQLPDFAIIPEIKYTSDFNENYEDPKSVPCKLCSY